MFSLGRVLLTFLIQVAVNVVVIDGQTCPQTVVGGTVDCTNYAVGRGQLGLKGIQLVDQFENIVQLRGVSSHGLQHAPDCVTKESIAYMVSNWGINVYRAVVYVDEWENGYTVNAAYFDDFIVKVVQWCKEIGIYVIIDWHIIGDPNAYMDEWYQPTSGLGLDFFNKYSLLYKDETHVLYEIANEPDNVGWESLVWYHNLIIDAIRVNCPDAIIIAGTPELSQEIDKAFNDPVDNPHNVFYSFHFHAASHADLLPFFTEHVSKMPLFVTQWGVSEASGDGAYDVAVAEQYLDVCSGVNDVTPPVTVVSWLQWSYSDIVETASLLEPNSCSKSKWEDTSCPGKFTENYMKSRAYGDTVLDCDRAPTHAPTISSFPTSIPSSQPSGAPSSMPSSVPSILPSSTPSAQPSISQAPTGPSAPPTSAPSSKPSKEPTSGPTVEVVSHSDGGGGSGGIPPEGIFFIAAASFGFLMAGYYFYDHRKTRNENDNTRSNFHQVPSQFNKPRGDGGSGVEMGSPSNDPDTASVRSGGGGGTAAGIGAGAAGGALVGAGAMAVGSRRQSDTRAGSEVSDITEYSYVSKQKVQNADEMDLSNIYNTEEEEGSFSTSRRDSLREVAQSLSRTEEQNPPPPPHPSRSPSPPRPPSPTSSVTSSTSSLLSRQQSRRHSSRGQTPSPPRRIVSARDRNKSPGGYQRSTFEPTRGNRSIREKFK